MKLQPARGTQDILPENSQLFRWIDQTAFHQAQLYGCQEIDTPIFEFSEVFHRTLGETSDVVSKETYTFTDRGGDSLTLRPEGTAGIARAFISNGLQQLLPLKYYYSGPMFRYERPQKGRFRQFHQLGVEMLGCDLPQHDVECIALGYDMLKALGLQGKFKILLNSLGDRESRATHREKLVEYLSKFKTELSADSQVRLEKNPLRILDSKDPKDQSLLVGAPLLKDCLTDNAKAFFETVQVGLHALQIPYELDTKLVRGLDYYVHTVFEFTTDLLGAQSAILAGGRYDGLIERMGGPKTSGVGFASGLERLALLVNPIDAKQSLTRLAVLSAEDSTETECYRLAQHLRSKGLAVELLLGDAKLGNKLKRANKINADYAFILGSAELSQNSVMMKNLKTGDQKLVLLSAMYSDGLSFPPA
jgi:histidyl-tRNA synthetase